MNNTSDLKFECVHCGKCCTDLNTLVNTTYLDILRIRAGLNLTQDEIIEILGFYIFDKKPTTKEIDRMVVPPIETERGLAFTGLKKQSSGQCYFYNKKKKRCSIYKFRPNFCRTFPFTFKLIINKGNSKENAIKVFYTEKGLQYCQGIGEEKPVIEMDNWIQLGQRVIQDLTKNTVLIKKWNEGVRKKVIIPSVRNFIITIINLEE
ncbi:MAG: YkgJ family cysteine cluster protein [Candidatus Lokiarchaeota archaeon]|nr:YkgJ family cysteine cluster protein [Candidatus Lokiarchaeota archaeon]